MKNKYQSVLSATVLERKRVVLHRRVYSCVCLSFIIISLACNVAQLHYRKKLADERSAPDWAHFAAMKQGDKVYEWMSAFDDNNVPTNLTINGEQWTIVHVNHYDDIDIDKRGKIPGSHEVGMTNCSGHVISYVGSDSPRLIRVDLMHEVFHAGACLHGGDEWWNSINPTEKNHPGVYHLGEFMSNFAHDNPDFMKWEAGQ